MRGYSRPWPYAWLALNHLFLPRESSFSVVVEAASAARRDCPKETVGIASTSGPSDKPQSTQLVMGGEPGLEGQISWVDFDGNEQPWGDLPEMSTPVSAHTFVGHVWRVRGTDARLLLEYTVSKVPKDVMTVQSCGSPKVFESDKGESDAELQWLQTHGHLDGTALAQCPTEALLSKKPFTGFHVICLVREPNMMRLCIFADGFRFDRCSHLLSLKSHVQNALTVNALIDVVRQRLKRKPRRHPENAMAIFTGSGREIKDSEQLFVPYRNVLVLIEGGVWQWPPVHVGFRRPMGPIVQYEQDGKKVLEEVWLKTSGDEPRVFEVQNFILDAECVHIKEKAGPHMKKSHVQLKDKDRGRLDDDWRTSATYFLSSSGDTVLHGLDRRVQNLTRIPASNGEYMQILRYDYMGRYTSHHDYFDPRDYKKDRGIMEMTQGGAANRILTVFIYLNDVASGGETAFPRFGNNPVPRDFGDCSVGLRVKPQKGKVILFYNLLPNGKLDPLSLHGGCRVLEKNASKWSANFWLWNKKKNFKNDGVYKEIIADLGLGGTMVDDKWEEQQLSELARQSAQNGADRLDEEVLEL